MITSGQCSRASRRVDRSPTLSGQRCVALAARREAYTRSQGELHAGLQRTCPMPRARRRHREAHRGCSPRCRVPRLPHDGGPRRLHRRPPGGCGLAVHKSCRTFRIPVEGRVMNSPALAAEDRARLFCSLLFGAFKTLALSDTSTGATCGAGSNKPASLPYRGVAAADFAGLLETVRPAVGRARLAKPTALPQPSRRDRPGNGRRQVRSCSADAAPARRQSWSLHRAPRRRFRRDSFGRHGYRADRQ